MDTQTIHNLDTGLRSLVTVSRFHKLSAQEPFLQSLFGVPCKLLGNTTTLCATKPIGFKTRQAVLIFNKINHSVLPEIIVTNNGDVDVLLKRYC